MDYLNNIAPKILLKQNHRFCREIMDIHCPQFFCGLTEENKMKKFRGRPRKYEQTKELMLNFLKSQSDFLNLRQISIKSQINYATTRILINDLLKSNIVEERNEVNNGRAERLIRILSS